MIKRCLLWRIWYDYNVCLLPGVGVVNAAVKPACLFTVDMYTSINSLDPGAMMSLPWVLPSVNNTIHENS